MSVINTFVDLWGRAYAVAQTFFDFIFLTPLFNGLYNIDLVKTAVDFLDGFFTGFSYWFSTATLGSVIIGVGIQFFVIYTLVKWVVGIVTGS